MARRGVLVLLSCAWALVAAGPAPAGSERPGVRGAELVAPASPVVVAQAAAPAVPARPRLISLDFKDADINNILRILAEFSGLNIVTSDDVKGKVTVRLQNVPWQQALDSVVRAAKLAYVQEGNIIRVDRLENLTKEAEAAFKAEQREVEISQRRKEAEIRLAEQERAAELSRREFDLRKRELEDRTAPLTEEIITLKYAHVGPRKIQIFDFLSDSVRTEEQRGVEDAVTGGVKKEIGKVAGLLSERGQITIDTRTNALIIRDLPDQVAKIREFVTRIDRPLAAVQIEARIVEMSKDDARRLGVIWGGAFTPRAGSNSPIIDLRGGAGPRVTDETNPIPPSSASFFPAPVLASGNLFGLALGWLASNFALDLTLQAAERDGRARVIASPSLMTLENEPATVSSGTQVPIIQVTTLTGGGQQTTVTFKDIETKFQVTPRVIPGENKLALVIAVRRSVQSGTIVSSGETAPIVDKRETVTQTRIPDGGTVVIGGLREDSQQGASEGVPWLKKIPVLGWLFKNDSRDARRFELVVFLTAKVVDNPGQAGVPVDQLPAPAPAAPRPPGPSGHAPAPEGALPAVSSLSPAVPSRSLGRQESER